MALGNILMLSEGKAGVENAYTLKEGKCSRLGERFVIRFNFQIGLLTMHLDKESYERAGLVGVPDGVKGKRGTKPWWGKCYPRRSKNIGQGWLTVMWS